LRYRDKPSIWFYNVGSPLNFALPLKLSPQVNIRAFNMAVGHVLGGGSSINAMVWSRGMARGRRSAAAR
jgi:choline dehydrogenase